LKRRKICHRATKKAVNILCDSICQKGGLVPLPFRYLASYFTQVKFFAKL
jgi:hypothetical protein